MPVMMIVLVTLGCLWLVGCVGERAVLFCVPQTKRMSKFYIAWKNMSLTLKILMDEKPVGILPGFDQFGTLSDLRVLIEDELDLETDFFFIDGGTRVSKDCESDFEVTSIAGYRPDDVGRGPVEIKVVSNHEGASATYSDENPKTPPPTDTSCSFLRSPTSWEIKIYSESEIAQAKGAEKERRLFWNRMAKKLCKETKKTRDQIGNIIDQKWQVYQSKQLIEKDSNLPVGESSTVKSLTLKRNADRLRGNISELENLE
ncbi:hypothetical protein AC249_AIPGENE9170 [Exaiptasia diaphana]|nr:hypothetical protein AC249_AIPGENE9170 [Exaiptasia diaphana]